jgi:hypothetical protein
MWVFYVVKHYTLSSIGERDESAKPQGFLANPLDSEREKVVQD